MPKDAQPNSQSESHSHEGRSWLSRIKDVLVRTRPKEVEETDEFTIYYESKEDQNRRANERFEKLLYECADRIGSLTADEDTEKEMLSSLVRLKGALFQIDVLTLQNIRHVGMILEQFTEKHRLDSAQPSLNQSILDLEIPQFRKLLKIATTQRSRRLLKQKIAKMLVAATTMFGAIEGSHLALDQRFQDFLGDSGKREQIVDTSYYSISEETIAKTYAAYFQDTQITSYTWRETAFDLQHLARIYYAAQEFNDRSFDEYFLINFMPTLYDFALAQHVDFPYLVTAMRISGQNMGPTASYPNPTDRYNTEEVDLSNKQYQMEVFASLAKDDPMLSLIAPNIDDTIHDLATAGAGLKNQVTIQSELAKPDEQRQIALQRYLSKNLPMNYYDIVRLLNPTLGGMDMEDRSLADGLAYLQSVSTPEDWQAFVKSYPDVVEAANRVRESFTELDHEKALLRDMVDQLLVTSPKIVDAFFSMTMHTDAYPPAWDEIGLGKNPDYSLLTKYTRLWRVATYYQTGNRDEIFGKAAQQVRAEFEGIYEQNDPNDDYRRALFADNIYDNPAFLKYLGDHAGSQAEAEQIVALSAQVRQLQAQADRVKTDQIHMQGVRNRNRLDVNLDFQLQTIVAMHGALYRMAEESQVFPPEQKANISLLALAIREISNTYLLSRETNYPIIRGVDSPYNPEDLAKNIGIYLDKIRTELDMDPAVPFSTATLIDFLQIAPRQDLADRLDKTISSAQQYNSIYRVVDSFPRYFDTVPVSKTPVYLPMGASPKDLKFYPISSTITAINYSDTVQSLIIPIANLDNGLVWNDPDLGFMRLNPDGSMVLSQNIFIQDSGPTPFRAPTLSEPAKTSEDWQELVQGVSPDIQSDATFSSEISKKLQPYEDVFATPFDKSFYSEARFLQIWNESVLDQTKEYILKKMGMVWWEPMKNSGYTINMVIGERGIVQYYLDLLGRQKIIAREGNFAGDISTVYQLNANLREANLPDYQLPDFFGQIHTTIPFEMRTPGEIVKSLIISAGPERTSEMLPIVEQTYEKMQDINRLRAFVGADAIFSLVMGDFEKNIDLVFPDWQRMTEWLYTIKLSEDYHLVDAATGQTLMDLGNFRYLNIQLAEFKNDMRSPIGTRTMWDLKELLDLINSPGTDKDKYMEHIGHVVDNFHRYVNSKEGWIAGMTYDDLHVGFNSLQSFVKADVQFEVDPKTQTITMSDRNGNVMSQTEAYEDITFIIEEAGSTQLFTLRPGSGKPQDVADRLSDSLASFTNEMKNFGTFLQKQVSSTPKELIYVTPSSINQDRVAITVSTYFMDGLHIDRKNLLFVRNTTTGSLDLINTDTDLYVLKDLNMFESVIVGNKEVSISPMSPAVVDELNAILHAPKN